MAMKSVAGVVSRSSLCRIIMDGGFPKSSSLLPRYFSADGRVLNEEEHAQETIYIKKMEREKQEKRKLQMEKERAEKEKGADKKSKDETKKD